MKTKPILVLSSWCVSLWYIDRHETFDAWVYVAMLVSAVTTIWFILLLHDYSKKRVEFNKLKGKVLGGIDFLNNNARSKWKNKIDASKIDIRSCDMCVLGQVYGEYFRARRGLGLTELEARALGFCGWSDEIEGLNKEWKRRLK